MMQTCLHHCRMRERKSAVLSRPVHLHAGVHAGEWTNAVDKMI